jgi:hypothetical protein
MFSFINWSHTILFRQNLFTWTLLYLRSTDRHVYIDNRWRCVYRLKCMSMRRVHTRQYGEKLNSLSKISQWEHVHLSSYICRQCADHLSYVNAVLKCVTFTLKYDLKPTLSDKCPYSLDLLDCSWRLCHVKHTFTSPTPWLSHAFERSRSSNKVLTREAKVCLVWVINISNLLASSCRQGG